tara:strand:- start:2284 stop:2469 length:186 start_codon:yes stop_codon:yes gene_type:complete
MEIFGGQMENEESEMTVKFDPTEKVWFAFQKSDGNPCLGVSPRMSEAIDYCAERVEENKSE